MAGVGVAENLSESEQRVWDAFATGSLVDFRTRNAAGDDPAAGRGRGPHRQVRAEVVCAALRLERCHVSAGVNLADATGRAIMLEQCRLGAVNLMGASITSRLSSAVPSWRSRTGLRWSGTG